MYYDKIDYEIIRLSWQQLSNHVNLPYVIHIVGTNGKGSTGRFLSSLFYQLNLDTLHYSSPHILNFNERIWINGDDVSDERLNLAHEKLQVILDENLLDQLTYFEYTTLLALYLSDNRDYLVLEAGLGGEFDATNVVENDLTIVTTIGLDHQKFLGDTISLIAATKMRSCNNRFILANQIFDEVYDMGKDILSLKDEVELKEYSLSDEANLLPYYLQNNLKTSLSVLEYLGFKDFTYNLPLIKGRFEKVAKNIIVDVGHNPLAAKAIVNELKNQNQKFILIYNSYADKDYKEVLSLLKPYISEVQLIYCDDTRMVDKTILLKIINDLSLKVNDFDIINMNKQNNYLVFGSFVVVENFLQRYNKI